MATVLPPRDASCEIPASNLHRKIQRAVFLAFLLLLAPRYPHAAAVDLDDATRPFNGEPLPGLAAAHENELLPRVYAGGGAPLLWTQRGRPTRQAHELVELLRSVEGYGLRPSDYAVDRLTAEYNRLAYSGVRSEIDCTQFDLALTRAAIRLIAHLHYGRVDPRAAGFELQEPRNDLDVASTIAALATAPSVAAVVAAVEPSFYHYELLKAALARYQRLTVDPFLTRLPRLPRSKLRTGDEYLGAPALRRLLTAVGDLSATTTLAAPDDRTLDGALVDALKRFQDRHGLPNDGVLGPNTYAALTTPLTQRVRQIELTLERWRWLPPFKSPPIIVNIPEFRLFAFRTTEDRVADIMQMPVIVGQTYRAPVRRYSSVTSSTSYSDRTGTFRAASRCARCCPRSRPMPIICHVTSRDGAWSERRPCTVLTPSAQTIDALAAGQLRLRQRPGDDNALGLVKFVFPNAHDVYMHWNPRACAFSAIPACVQPRMHPGERPRGVGVLCAA